MIQTNKSIFHYQIFIDYSNITAIIIELAYFLWKKIYVSMHIFCN